MTWVSDLQRYEFMSDLHRAAHKGDMAEVRRLLHLGADPLSLAHGEDGPTPIFLAETAGHKEVARMLRDEVRRRRKKGPG